MDAVSRGEFVLLGVWCWVMTATAFALRNRPPVSWQGWPLPRSWRPTRKQLQLETTALGLATFVLGVVCFVVAAAL
jgi:DNA-binding helix-hairpin-helix protein with protein kinase domain